jgi:hypothetical protein
MGEGDFDGGAIENRSDARSEPAIDATPPVPVFAELWYSVDDRLVLISLDPANGSVASVTQSTMSGLPLGQNSITMLSDGTLIGARLSESDDQTYFYYVGAPPRDGSPVTPQMLGVMPDGIMLEGLYTDCEGRLYGMDTGTNNSSSEGNRLILFTGNFLASDFSFSVISDLSQATVADIDDMGPAIVNNEISDNPGLAIDTSNVYDFDYQTGTGTLVGSGGTWGIHALGKELFDDSVARLFVFSSSAELFEMNPQTYELSEVLVTGPSDVSGNPGWSGLAGPLTECDSGFVID